MNKKAGERLLSVYWFVILIIIAIGIVSGVLHVVGAVADIRMAEAGLLREKLVECLINQGQLNSVAFDSLVSYDDATLLKTCRIDLEDRTQKYKDTKQYAVSLELYDENYNPEAEKAFGNTAMFPICCYLGYEKTSSWTFGGSHCSEDKPECIDTTIYVLSGGNKKFLAIKTAVDKNEKNVG